VVLAFILVEAAGMEYLFGIVIPYLAVAIFFVGLVWRILKWARSPVPFRIPTTGGQQKSFSWINQSKLDNPATPGQAFWRMVLEVLLFRSLFRNTAMQFDPKGPRINYATSKWLWFFALMFHYSFLTVLVRHLRFFTEPIPGWVNFIEMLDGMMDITLPALLISGFVLGGAVSFLLVRRLYLSNIRYISLFADYFPLLLILAIVTTGILMRYLFKTDIVSVKELTMGLVQFNPKLPEGVGSLFYVHVFLVSILFAYFPFSKLMHAGGVFMSPTRNLANNNRFIRHVNPWNYPVNMHTYEEYEDEFREQMVEAGLPVDRPLEPEPEEPEEEATESAEAESETAQEENDSGEKQ
jgi:nitrate reductase gamma subunit